MVHSMILSLTSIKVRPSVNQPNLHVIIILIIMTRLIPSYSMNYYRKGVSGSSFNIYTCTMLPYILCYYILYISLHLCHMPRKSPVLL